LFDQHRLSLPAVIPMRMSAGHSAAKVYTIGEQAEIDMILVSIR